MASVETHMQFTASQYKPEAQGTSGGEHLHMHILQLWIKDSTQKSVCTDILYTPTHTWSAAARLMMEWSGRLERHSHEVWLMNDTMTTERSILGGDISISWQEYRWPLEERVFV